MIFSRNLYSSFCLVKFKWDTEPWRRHTELYQWSKHSLRLISSSSLTRHSKEGYGESAVGNFSMWERRSFHDVCILQKTSDSQKIVQNTTRHTDPRQMEQVVAFHSSTEYMIRRFCIVFVYLQSMFSLGLQTLLIGLGGIIFLPESHKVRGLILYQSVSHGSK